MKYDVNTTRPQAATINREVTSVDPKTVTADPVEISAVSIAYYLPHNRCISPIIYNKIVVFHLSFPLIISSYIHQICRIYNGTVPQTATIHGVVTSADPETATAGPVGKSVSIAYYLQPNRCI